MSETLQKQRVRRPAVGLRTGEAVQDTFTNFAARLGVNADNLLSNSTYTYNIISRNRWLLEMMYRGSWLVGQAVDTVAEDMTRAGTRITSVLTPEEITKLKVGGEQKYNIWGKLCEAIKWSRLYGGAIAVILIKGHDPSTPLDVTRMGKGDFQGLLVLDRWQLQPTFNDLVDEFGPDLGNPRYYYVIPDSPAFKNMNIHYSRVLRFEGVKLPWWQRVSENFWGQSEIERVYDRLVAYDSVSMGAAQLAYKAHLRTVKIKELRNLIATGGEVLDALLQQMDLIRKLQQSEGLTLLDGEDEFATYTYTFAGLADILLQFGQQFSGATGIPLVRLFGQSPAGLNSTGDSDWENYYNNILQRQEGALRRPIHQIYEVLVPSVLGKPLDDEFTFQFVPLWQMTELDKSTISTQGTTAVGQAYATGVIDRALALKELKQLSEVTGMWSNISAKMIKEAENEPVLPMPGATSPEQEEDNDTKLPSGKGNDK